MATIDEKLKRCLKKLRAGTLTECDLLKLLETPSDGWRPIEFRQLRNEQRFVNGRRVFDGPDRSAGSRDLDSYASDLCPIAPPSTQQSGSVVAFDAISEPGAYVCHWSGHLLRVPQDGVAPGGSLTLGLVSREPLTVTKISDDPFITLARARLLAANRDLDVRF